MKYCIKCGNPMEDDMNFCQRCGTRAAQIPDAPPVVESPQHDHATIKYAVSEQPAPQKNKKSRSGMTVLGILCIFIALISVFLGKLIDASLFSVVAYFSVFAIMFLLLSKTPKYSTYLLGHVRGIKTKTFVGICCVLACISAIALTLILEPEPALSTNLTKDLPVDAQPTEPEAAEKEASLPSLATIQNWYETQISTISKELQAYATSFEGVTAIDVNDCNFFFGNSDGWYDCHYTVYFDCTINGEACSGEARAFVKYLESDIAWFHFEVFKDATWETLIEQYEDYDQIIEDYWHILETQCSSDSPALSPDTPTMQTPAINTANVIFYANSYAGASPQQVTNHVGTPTEITQTYCSGDFQIPCTLYKYSNHHKLGTAYFAFVNDILVRFTSQHSYPYKGVDTLSMFGINLSDSAVSVPLDEVGLRYRCVSNDIDDVWISQIDGENFGSITITYDMSYYDEWYLPVSSSLRETVQDASIQVIDSVLIYPDSAVYDNDAWACGMNDYYVSVFGNVQALTDGLSTRSGDFLIYYSVSTGELVYAILDGDVIADYGYTSTEDLLLSQIESHQ